MLAITVCFVWKEFIHFMFSCFFANYDILGEQLERHDYWIKNCFEFNVIAYVLFVALSVKHISCKGEVNKKFP